MRDLNTYAEDRQRQREEAAKRSAQVRKQRKAICEKMKKGEIDALALVRGELAPLEPFLKRWKLEFTLKAIPGIGPVGRIRILEAWGKSPNRRLGDMSVEEREQISSMIEYTLENGSK